jgi:hypothetical protein
MTLKVYKDNWYDFMWKLNKKIWIVDEKSWTDQFYIKNRALNPIVGLGCNFTWSLLICFPTLVKDLILIRVL